VPQSPCECCGTSEQPILERRYRALVPCRAARAEMFTAMTGSHRGRLVAGLFARLTPRGRRVRDAGESAASHAACVRRRRYRRIRSADDPNDPRRSGCRALFDALRVFSPEARAEIVALEFDAMLRRFANDPLFTSISITHLSILTATADEPAIVIASQVFATHYLNASLSLTALTGCGADGRRHLLYLRRSRVDVFHGTFGGLVRRIVNKRVRAEGRPLLESFRMKVELGPPLSTNPPRLRSVSAVALHLPRRGFGGLRCSHG